MSPTEQTLSRKDNRWLSHYLYGEDNGIEDMAEVTVQSNVDGSYRTYDSWRDFKYSDLSVSYEGETTEVSSNDLALYAMKYME